PPYVVRADGSVETADCKGSLLGVFEEVEVRDDVTVLHPLDALVLYTDGVTEEHAGSEIFGEWRLRALLETLAGPTAEEIAGGIEQAVVDFRSQEPRDDLAVLVLRLRPGVASALEGV